MVTPLPQSLLPPGVPELSMDAVCDRLDRMPEVKVIHRLQPSEKLQSTGLQPFCPEIAVVEAAEAQVPAMRSLHVHIEPDLPLSVAGPVAAPAAAAVPLRDPGLVMPLEHPVDITLRVSGLDGEPLAGAGVFLIGATWPAQGITGADGTAGAFRDRSRARHGRGLGEGRGGHRYACGGRHRRGGHRQGRHRHRGRCRDRRLQGVPLYGRPVRAAKSPPQDAGVTLENMTTHPPPGPAQPHELPPLSPMLAVIGPLPPPQTQGEYAYETLWNGERTIVHLPADGTVQFVSVAGLNVTAQYPELQALAGLLPAPEAVLDGEIVVLDDEGRPSVERLQQRISLHHPAAVDHARSDLPVQLMIYDILFLGEPTIQLPYTARRDLLDDLSLAGPGIMMPAAWPAMATAALEHSRCEGFDGIVAKRLTSPYLPGRRTRDWIKIKHLAPPGDPGQGTS
ncbi:hypothetical protein ABZ904_47700 [Streptomyces sp. NPDC046900]|uniref:ATP-dependent DNA ligase n=1 Tax=Streptomyces sp. NPDC046900 TaxID=3155473 RepID=UPI00340557AD